MPNLLLPTRQVRLWSGGKMRSFRRRRRRRLRAHRTISFLRQPQSELLPRTLTHTDAPKRAWVQFFPGASTPTPPIHSPIRLSSTCTLAWRCFKTLTVQFSMGPILVRWKADDAVMRFVLEPHDLKDLPCRSVRNPGKPYPDEFYNGATLLERAIERCARVSVCLCVWPGLRWLCPARFSSLRSRSPLWDGMPTFRHGGVDGFLRKLKRRSMCYAADPLNPPSTRYGVDFPQQPNVFVSKRNRSLCKLCPRVSAVRPGSTSHPCSRCALHRCLIL